MSLEIIIFEKKVDWLNYRNSYTFSQVGQILLTQLVYLVLTSLHFCLILCYLDLCSFYFPYSLIRLLFFSRLKLVYFFDYLPLAFSLNRDEKIFLKGQILVLYSSSLFFSHFYFFQNLYQDTYYFSVPYWSLNKYFLRLTIFDYQEGFPSYNSIQFHY